MKYYVWDGYFWHNFSRIYNRQLVAPFAFWRRRKRDAHF